jgi:hypothetical protein
LRITNGEPGDGNLTEQKDGDKQVVIFTIEGEITADQWGYWNQAVANLKRKFPQLVGVTLVPKTGLPADPPPGPLPPP